MNGLRTSRHADPTFQTQADPEFHGMSFPNFTSRCCNMQRSAIARASEFSWRLRWSTLRAIRVFVDYSAGTGALSGSRHRADDPRGRSLGM